MPRSVQPERPLRIDALIFDLDNTLWDVEPVILRAEESWPSSSRNPIRASSSDTLATMRELRTRLVIEHPAMQHDFTWLRLELLRRLASEADYPEDMARQAFDVFFRARNEVVLYDDVLPALTTLHTRCRLLRSATATRTGAIGLSHFFERSLCARGRVAQARPAHLLPAARRCGSRCRARGARRRRSEADIEGARGAGLRAVWLNRQGTPWPASTAAPSCTSARWVNSTRCCGLL